jgi:hypothetical protein
MWSNCYSSIIKISSVIANQNCRDECGSQVDLQCEQYKSNTASVPGRQPVDKGKVIVIRHNTDSFGMRDPSGTGPETLVLLSSQTEVKSHKKCVFRGSKPYGVSHIRRGLRLVVDGQETPMVNW